MNGDVSSEKMAFDSVKIFSTTVMRDRQAMGESITRWLEANQGIEIADTVVTQSSDDAFHCLTVAIFYRAL